MATDDPSHNRKIVRIQTADVAEKYRRRIIDTHRKRVLVSRLTATSQESDLTLPSNCRGLGRIHHFRRETAPGWPQNPLPLDPACKKLDRERVNLIQAQVFQNAACPWRCWYCFVPFNLLGADTRHSEWLGADELISMYLDIDDRPPVLDLSGGSPDLTPEWVVWVMEELIQRGAVHSTYLWSDDNLSTDYIWTALTDSQRKLLASYPTYGRVACFKGFDSESFEFNTGAAASEFELQFSRFSKLLRLGVDLYAYVTLTGPNPAKADDEVVSFMDRLQSIHPLLPLRTVPLRIGIFSPVSPRLNEEREASLATQEIAINAWNAQIRSRFSDEQLQCNIAEIRLE